MGGTASAQNPPEADALEQFEALLKDAQNEHLGTASVYKKKTAEEFRWVKEQRFDSDELQAFLQQYIADKLYRQPFFTTLQVQAAPGQAGSAGGGLCSGCGSQAPFVVVVEALERTLLGEILQRAGEKQGADFFEEPEIWFILESLIQMERFVAKYPRRVHGNLRLASVLINEEGILFFLDPMLLFPKETNYSKAVTSGFPGPVSPEELRCRSQRKAIPKVDCEASEVYVIGMELLCIALLVEEHKFYDWKNLEVLAPLLSEGLKKAQRKYSDELVDLIKSCLDPNPESRPTIEVLYRLVEDRKGSMTNNSQTLET